MRHNLHFILSEDFSYLYLSKERSARFLSRRERFNASTPAQLFLHSGISGSALHRTSP